MAHPSKPIPMPYESIKKEQPDEPEEKRKSVKQKKKQVKNNKEETIQS